MTVSDFHCRTLRQHIKVALLADKYSFDSLKDLAQTKALNLLQDCWQSPTLLEVVSNAWKALPHHNPVIQAMLQGIAERLSIYSPSLQFDKFIENTLSIESRLLMTISIQGCPHGQLDDARYCSWYTCRKNVSFKVESGSETCDECKRTYLHPARKPAHIFGETTEDM